nr:hypothetical protein [uncultured Flavobacterium sp.]
MFPTFINSQNLKFIDELSQMSEKNKSQHYWVSNIGTTAIGYGLYRLTGRIGLSCLGGGLIMYGIGELKEDVWDGYLKKGTKSGGDKFMNGQGCLFGIPQARVVIDIHQRKEKRKIGLED